jgi:predicted branched-subunit amino acid permease
MDTREFAAGARSVAPMLAGVVPFGLVAGAAPVAEGGSVADAMGLSLFVFAGASQLALIDVLAGGAGPIVAALTAWTINLRMLLYSASLAPHLTREGTGRRYAASYFLVDQVYASSIAHWSNRGVTPKVEFMLGGGLCLAPAWLASTFVGAVAGSTLPEGIPLDFTIPLLFMVLLIPVLTTRPALVAAVVGGCMAVIGAGVGDGNLAVIIGAVSGIAAGVVADLALTSGDADPSLDGPDSGVEGP